jgi:hypothetical protein
MSSSATTMRAESHQSSLRASAMGSSSGPVIRIVAAGDGSQYGASGGDRTTKIFTPAESETVTICDGPRASRQTGGAPTARIRAAKTIRLSVMAVYPLRNPRCVLLAMLPSPVRLGEVGWHVGQA